MFVLPTGASAASVAPVMPAELLSTQGVAATQPPLGEPMHERLHLRFATLNVLAGHTMSASGSLRPRLADAKVSLQLLLGHHWVSVASTRTGARGRFTLRYVPPRIGGWVAQLRYRGTNGAPGATRQLGVLNAFATAEASWYGGGGGLACGGELTNATMGVANKTLPCGTWLTIRYGERNVRVQVIDRGPYVAGREFDLTEATKRALDFEGVGVVWATR